jgi:hypothetical protein
MGYSSLLGTKPVAVEPEGRDIAALGPSDSSDSGSDVVGVEAWFGGADPSEPVDVALRGDRQRSALPPDALAGGPVDSAGTGERRSAGGDAGTREALDISVDQVFDLGDPAWESPTGDLEQVDGAAAPDLEAEEGEEEDESADPVGDGHSDAEAAQRQARGRPPGRASAAGRKS